MRVGRKKPNAAYKKVAHKPLAKKITKNQVEIESIDPAHHPKLLGTLREIFSSENRIPPSKIPLSLEQIGNTIWAKQLLVDLAEESDFGLVISFKEIQRTAMHLKEIYRNLDLIGELKKMLKKSFDTEKQLLAARLLLALDYKIFSPGFLIRSLEKKYKSYSADFNFWTLFLSSISDDELGIIFNKLGDDFLKDRKQFGISLSQVKDKEKVLRIFLECAKLDFDVSLPDYKKMRTQLALVEFMRNLSPEILTFSHVKELYLNAAEEDVVQETSELLREKFNKLEVAELHLEVAKDNKEIYLMKIIDTQSEQYEDEVDMESWLRMTHFRKVRLIAIREYANLLGESSTNDLLEILKNEDDPLIVNEICLVLSDKNVCGSWGQNKLVEFVKRQIEKEEESIPLACIVRMSSNSNDFPDYYFILQELMSSKFEEGKLENAFSSLTNIKLFLHKNSFEIAETTPDLSHIILEIGLKKLAEWMTVGDGTQLNSNKQLKQNVKNLIEYALRNSEKNYLLTKGFQKLKEEGERKLNKHIKQAIGFSDTR